MINIPESERAAYDIMLRQMAPKIRETFEVYSVQLQASFHDVYLIARYKTVENMERLSDPSCTVIELRCLNNKDFVRLPYMKNNEDTQQQLLFEMFPLLKDTILEYAQKWKVSYTDVFLMLNYKKGQDMNSADSIELQLRARGTKFAERIE